MSHKKQIATTVTATTVAIVQKLSVPVYGQINTFKQLFALLMDVSKREHLLPFGIIFYTVLH